MIFIAEFCQNHNGDFELLKEMIHAAKESGADYAKIQTIFADMLTYRKRFEKGIVKEGLIEAIERPYKSEYDRLKTLEISMEQQAIFVDLCKKVGIKPLTTVFTCDSVKSIKHLGFESIKIASYDCASPPLLKLVKNEFNKIFVSTGATYDNEIAVAAELLSGSDFSLLHCVTIYPTPIREFHLARMSYLRKYCDYIGWSDHSLVQKDGILGTCAAVYYGADIIERHFTLLPSDKTKDGPVSILPEHLKELRYYSSLAKAEQKEYLEIKLPQYEVTWGNANRELSKTEILNRDYYRGRFANMRTNGTVLYNWEDMENV